MYALTVGGLGVPTGEANPDTKGSEDTVPAKGYDVSTSLGPVQRGVQTATNVYRRFSIYCAQSVKRSALDV